MDVHRVWAWMKVILTVTSLVVLIVLAIGGYFYYKDYTLVEEEVSDLEALKNDFKDQMGKVNIFAFIFN